MPEPASPIEIDDFILDTLADHKCLFILGPDILQLSKQGTSLRKAFHQHLLKHAPQEGSWFEEFYAQEELYLFRDGQAQSRFYYEMRRFFQARLASEGKEGQPPPIDRQVFEQLKAFPCPLFLNGSPDTALQQAFGRASVQFDAYDKSQPKLDVPDFSVKNPLIYNLLGTLEREESLLLTHDDLFRYLEQIFAEGQVPPKIIETLFSARCLLFLGVGFEKWYVQLLLRLLKVNDHRARFTRYATQGPLDPVSLSICEDQFNIKFVTAGIPAFVAALHAAAEARGGMLMDRPQVTEQETLKAKVIRLTYEDRLEEALGLLADEFEGKNQEAFDTALNLQGQLRRLDLRKSRGQISQVDYDVQYQNLAEQIRELANELDHLDA